MRWDTVKAQVAGRVAQTIREGRDWQVLATILVDKLAADQPVLARTAFAAYADKAEEIIMAWDIRCAGKLRELFPACFPKSLQGRRPLIAEYDANGNWVISLVS